MRVAPRFRRFRLPGMMIRVGPTLLSGGGERQLVFVELQDVVGSVDESPLGPHGGAPASSEPAHPAIGLRLRKHGLDHSLLSVEAADVVGVKPRDGRGREAPDAGHARSGDPLLVTPVGEVADDLVSDVEDECILRTVLGPDQLLRSHDPPLPRLTLHVVLSPASSPVRAPRSEPRGA